MIGPKLYEANWMYVMFDFSILLSLPLLGIWLQRVTLLMFR